MLIDIVKMSVTSDLIHKFNIIHQKSSKLFVDIDNLNLEFICKGTETRGFKTILKKNNVRIFKLFDLKTYYKATVNTVVVGTRISTFINVTNTRLREVPTQIESSDF